MIWPFIDVFSKVRGGQKSLADDSVDKLNRSVTVILFVMACIFITSKSFGAQIVCLEDGMKILPFGMDYVTAVCWIKDVKVIESFFSNAIENKNSFVHTNSYPWIPLIILFFALIFYLPYLLWKRMVRKNNYQHVPIDVSSVVKLLLKSPTYKRDEFNKNISEVAEYLNDCFTLNNYTECYLDEETNARLSDPQNTDDIVYKSKVPRTYADRCKPFEKKRQMVKFYFPLVLKYLFIKLVYLFVSVFIFYLADKILAFRAPYLKFGLNMYTKYSSENETEIETLTNRYFPLNVLCNLKTRVDFKNFVTSQHHCTLPANMFNEKLFLILWVWLVFMVLVNTYSLLKWIVKFLFRRSIIRNMLMWPYRQGSLNEKQLKSFVYDYLSGEGFLMLMLIKSNTQDWYCRSLVKELWKLFVKNESQASVTPTFNYDILSTVAKPNRREILRVSNTYPPDDNNNTINNEKTPIKPDMQYKGNFIKMENV